MSQEEIRAQFVQQVYEIMDGHECWITCALCRMRAGPTKDALYDYRRVVHDVRCIVPELQAMLGIEMFSAVVESVQDVPRIAEHQVE